MRLILLISGIVFATFGTAQAGPLLFVSSGTFQMGGEVLRFDSSTGLPVNNPFVSCCIANPQGLIFGPDGNLYVTTGGPGGSVVLKFNGETGASMGTFVNFINNVGPFNSEGLVFGPDGNLYVSSGSSVLKYNGSTGAPLGAFVSSGSGGLNFVYGLTFGPDGNLYVTNSPACPGGCSAGGQVLKYDGTTGAFLGTFVDATPDKLYGPGGIVFGPDGNLYVDSQGSSQIQKYNGSTGAFIATFVTNNGKELGTPLGMVFGPDGNLYVASQVNNRVIEYDGSTGAFLNIINVSGSSPNNAPRFLAFAPAPPSVPEPSTLFLCGIGVLFLMLPAARNASRKG